MLCENRFKSILHSPIVYYIVYSHIHRRRRQPHRICRLSRGMRRVVEVRIKHICCARMGLRQAHKSNSNYTYSTAIVCDRDRMYNREHSGKSGEFYLLYICAKRALEQNARSFALCTYYLCWLSPHKSRCDVASICCVCCRLIANGTDLRGVSDFTNSPPPQEFHRAHNTPPPPPQQHNIDAICMQQPAAKSANNDDGKGIELVRKREQ